MRGKVNQEPDFLRFVIFRDETKFCNNGAVNRHNCHYYALGNPRWIRESHFQQVVSINMWCGTIDSYIVVVRINNTQVSAAFLFNLEEFQESQLTMGDFEKEQERLLRLWQEVSSDIDIFFSTDERESDFLEEKVDSDISSLSDDYQKPIECIRRSTVRNREDTFETLESIDFQQR
ncbi:hypothetical protein BDFB_010813 [Asbolus verrucosus]|uniref:DDE 3 domain containing protein n=1 Tax=Asbolus verrucosus TaxID=1661398 RepID=A0A482W5Y1_ASBVE|nr:hypothetical protein BDFB_010813 [Asbolus verrucosus]